MKMYAKGEEIKGTGHYDSNNHWVYDSNGTTSVLQHCIDVGVFCKYLLENIFYKDVTLYLAKQMDITPNEVISCFSFFAGVHDIGKVHPYFQNNFKNAVFDMLKKDLIDKDDLSESVRHEVISRLILDEYLSTQEGYYEISENLLNGLLYTISAHHEKDNNNYKVLPKKYKRQTEKLSYWKNEQQKIVTELHEIFPFDIAILKKCNIKNTDKICSVFFMLLVTSDWPSSAYLSNYYSKFNSYLELGNIEGYISFLEKEIDIIVDKELGLKFENHLDLSSFSKIIKEKRYTLRPIQREIKKVMRKKNPPKFVIIEAPMGEGKTEAGLYAAGQMGKEGIAFSLPTGVTTDMMYNRIEDLCKSQNVKFLNKLHATSFLTDKLYETEIKDKYNIISSSRFGLFVENSVSTVDQVMKGVLRIKFASLRLLGLMKKVLIIDEVHAYDAYMQGILHILLSWCSSLEIPVVLLSATLPKNIRKNLIESYYGKFVELKKDSYPLITFIDSKNNVIETPVSQTFIHKKANIKNIRINNDDYSGLVKSIKNKLSKNQNIAVICNTVKESVFMYELLKGIENSNCLLIHSKFTVGDRKEKENYIVKNLGKKKLSVETRPKRLIVVGTQVLEQSLDIDFDCMYSMLCPIDLLLQRMGRWRRFDIEGRKEDFDFFVVYNQLDEYYKKYSLIYPKYLLRKTEEFLSSHSIITLPEDFRKSLTYVYDNADTSSDYLEMVKKNEDYLNFSKSKSINTDMGDISQRENAISSICEKDDEDDDMEFESFSTRLSVPTQKVIFLTLDILSKSGLDLKDIDCFKLKEPEKSFKTNYLESSVDKEINFQKYKEKAKILLNHSFSIMCSDLPEKYENSFKCKGLLKGYTIYFVEKLNENEIGFSYIEKNVSKTLCYSKEYGYYIK